MGLFSEEHPYSAVTEYINRMCGESYEEEDLSGLPDLIEVVKLQDGGPTEASRAIRKKLKYGSHHQQVRALVILDALVSNAGKSFQRRFGDEMLLDRLRTMATDGMTDRDIKNRLAGMFIGWNEEFKDIPAMNGVAHLKDSLPRKKKAAPVVRAPTPESGDEDQAAPQIRSQGHSRNTSAAGPSTPKQPSRKSTEQSTPNREQAGTSRYRYVEPTSPPKDKSSTSFFGGSNSAKTKVPKEQRPVKVSLEKERPKILQTIAAANQASTNLQNALKHVNKEDATFLKDPQIVKSHRDCRELRKNVLHYIAGIESEEWVGTLLQTNDGLVSALQLHEEYRLIATAPDSDEEEQREMQRRHVTDVYGVDDEDLPPRKPARPTRPTSTGPAVSRSKKPLGTLAMPPARPIQVSESSEEEEESEAEVESILSEGDEDDPFANRNEDLALKTPAIEKSQPRW
ncbi:VHS domain protein [Taphrina deformans PYCC 5710]|uniref:VHS domain protein n=1 Tax=Taphrina deformans (strain PYCC 5710 / ATCC 11124 / CBS 356.35 / IMI 108563 / JCM 9778 / NBRC 8474) TaxID=1097556 RepID=R4XEQ2_TAPDE|nr:VHS domain protein [Taphrina deformans PYCC 5710]|eukprot:CCG82951.1 VHS domain protein [Taphrina deformans PYCC 5710]